MLALDDDHDRAGGESGLHVEVRRHALVPKRVPVPLEGLAADAADEVDLGAERAEPGRRVGG